MTPLSLDHIAFHSHHGAIEALKAVGCTYLPDLDLLDDDPSFGPTERVFGLLGNIRAPSEPIRNRSVADRLERLLADEDNHRVLAKLESGELPYTPVSKATVKKIDDHLRGTGLHVPWAFTVMNADLAMKVERMFNLGKLSLNVFYSRVIKLETLPDGRPGVVPGRLFSLPVGVDSQGTWLQPIYEEILDEDVGLLLEADIREAPTEELIRPVTA